jgi:hypothetical protein
MKAATTPLKVSASHWVKSRIPSNSDPCHCNSFCKNHSLRNKGFCKHVEGTGYCKELRRCDSQRKKVWQPEEELSFPIVFLSRLTWQALFTSKVILIQGSTYLYLSFTNLTLWPLNDMKKFGFLNKSFLKCLLCFLNIICMSFLNHSVQRQ